MSSRQLRKLRKQQELLAEQNAAPKPDDESQDDEPIRPQPRTTAFSGFAALAQIDDGDDAGDQEDDEPQDETPAEPPVTIEKANPKSKKSKKKKKGKKTHSAQAAEAQPQGDDGPDEIDRVLAELDKSLSTAAIVDEDHPREPGEFDKLFSINFHHLRVMNEVRGTFGRGIIATALAEDQPEQPAPRRPQDGPPRHASLESFLRAEPSVTGRKIPEVLIRRNPFVQWKDTWPQALASGLTMRYLGEPGAIHSEFKFEHDLAYMQMEAMFFSCVQTHDIGSMIWFLKRNRKSPSATSLRWCFEH